MTKQQYIDSLNKGIDQCKNSIKGYIEEITIISKCKEIFISDLIVDFEKEHSDYMTKNEVSGNYEFILGGDGRSRPWSEQRFGKILELKLSDVYVSDEDLRKFHEYLKTTTKFNSIKINGITQ